MEAEVDPPSVGNDNLMTVKVEPHHDSGTLSETITPSVQSGSAPELIQSDGTESEKGSEQVPTKIQYLPSRYKITPPRRMATRSVVIAEKKNKPKKRKQPVEDSNAKKSPRVGKGTHGTKAKKPSVPTPSTNTVSHRQKDVTGKRKSQTKSPVTQKTKKSHSKAAVTVRNVSSPTKAAATSSSNKSLTKAATAPSSDKSPKKSAGIPQGKSSVKKAEIGAQTVGIKVKFTPSKRKSSVPIKSAPRDHDYEVGDPSECNKWKKRALNSEARVKVLRKERHMFTMRAYRAQKRNEKLMQNILLEQKMHKETQQTLKAIMRGLHLQIATVDPGAIGN